LLLSCTSHVYLISMMTEGSDYVTLRFYPVDNCPHHRKYIITLVRWRIGMEWTTSAPCLCWWHLTFICCIDKLICTSSWPDGTIL
jgi:hypothetical protein